MSKLPLNIRRALEAEDIEALKVALSPRQRAFAEEYVVDFNGAAAAIRAGYAPTWADRQAHQLIKHEGIARYIDHLSRSKEAKIVSVDPDYLIQRLHEIMVKEGTKDGDKIRAIELLMKHKGMFIERQEISGPDGEAIKVEQETRQSAQDVVSTLKRMGKPNLKVVGEE